LRRCLIAVSDAVLLMSAGRLFRNLRGISSPRGERPKEITYIAHGRKHCHARRKLVVIHRHELLQYFHSFVQLWTTLSMLCKQTSILASHDRKPSEQRLLCPGPTFTCKRAYEMDVCQQGNMQTRDCKIYCN